MRMFTCSARVEPLDHKTVVMISGRLAEDSRNLPKHGVRVESSGGTSSRSVDPIGYCHSTIVHSSSQDYRITPYPSSLSKTRWPWVSHQILKVGPLPFTTRIFGVERGHCLLVLLAPGSCRGPLYNSGKPGPWLLLSLAVTDRLEIFYNLRSSVRMLRHLWSQTFLFCWFISLIEVVYGWKRKCSSILGYLVPSVLSFLLWRQFYVRRKLGFSIATRPMSGRNGCKVMQ